MKMMIPIILLFASVSFAHLAKINVTDPGGEVKTYKFSRPEDLNKTFEINIGKWTCDLHFENKGKRSYLNADLHTSVLDCSMDKFENSIAIVSICLSEGLDAFHLNKHFVVMSCRE